MPCTILFLGSASEAVTTSQTIKSVTVADTVGMGCIIILNGFCLLMIILN